MKKIVTFDKLVSILYEEWNWLYTEEEIISVIGRFGVRNFGHKIKYLGGGTWLIA
jgi:hypothetical protein